MKRWVRVLGAVAVGVLSCGAVVWALPGERAVVVDGWTEAVVMDGSLAIEADGDRAWIGVSTMGGDGKDGEASSEVVDRLFSFTLGEWSERMVLSFRGEGRVIKRRDELVIASRDGAPNLVLTVREDEVGRARGSGVVAERVVGVALIEMMPPAGMLLRDVGSSVFSGTARVVDPVDPPPGGGGGGTCDPRSCSAGQGGSSCSATCAAGWKASCSAGNGGIATCECVRC